MRIDRQRFSPLYWTFRPGQLLQSALWAACIREKQLGGQTNLLKRVACTPDRGDVCIMQGQIGGVNGFVVNIFVHYILSDKVVLELESQRGQRLESSAALTRAPEALPKAAIFQSGKRCMDNRQSAVDAR
ncbi:hypothetical protein CNN82_12810 [Pseudomonas frederiksbergensis]|uniref:Uncharacterized protein n=1 Tax=Pseudomonas frederiksbergensis TaxID=104087 RepID=A0AB33EDX7_9PSED|nr:hypothetical protein CNN82_12810 [Pseudomonas frederiksbergensis]